MFVAIVSKATSIIHSAGRAFGSVARRAPWLTTATILALLLLVW